MVRRSMSRLIGRFREEHAALTPEAVVIFPLLCWAYVAMFVFWDAYKTENLTLKAAYTVADMISREALPIDENFIDGANEIFGFLAGEGENDLRVTAVRMGVDAAGDPELNIFWSYSTGFFQAYTDAEDIEDKVPLLAVGDHMIVVEARQSWEPMWNVGLPARSFYQIAITKPRYQPCILWKTQSDCISSGPTS